MAISQPVTVDSNSLPSQTGQWSSGTTVSISSPQVWQIGDTVFAVIANAGSLTVTGVVPNGGNIGAFTKVTDGTTPASGIQSTVLEAEVWSAVATGPGQGTIVATLSGTPATYAEILTFALVNTIAGSTNVDKVSVGSVASGVEAFQAATSTYGASQALAIIATVNPSSTPTAGAGQTLIGNAINSTHLGISALLNTAQTPAAATAVTPTVSTFTQGTAGASIAFTILLRPVVLPPTAITATYTAGLGVTVSWTAPSGYTGTGYNLYKVPADTQNGVPQRVNAGIVESALGTTPAAIPWGTVTYVDKSEGYLPDVIGDNVGTYYVTTLNGILESPLSISATATFLG